MLWLWIDEVIHTLHCMCSSFHYMLLLSPFTMLCVFCRSENLHIAVERGFPPSFYPTLWSANSLHQPLCSLINPLFSQPWAVINSNTWYHILKKPQNCPRNWLPNWKCRKKGKTSHKVPGKQNVWDFGSCFLSFAKNTQVLFLKWQKFAEAAQSFPWK